jgi:V/A-type H+-transporting ATPase subunit A
MANRQKLMGLLQEEASLDEIVKMVGMDALSPADRLKMEAARSIREDYLHQNSFHEIDTYTSLKKQLLLMRLVVAYYEKSQEALSQGTHINHLIGLEVREEIGRYKYTEEDKIEQTFQEIMDKLDAQIGAVCGKEDF